jgi:CRISPR system Cascade subunit CasB
VSEVHPFVQYLYDLASREDRAALAELRRGLLSPLAPLRHVVPFLRRDASDWEERTLSTIGMLFALHPARGERSLADALRILAQESDSVELRFRALLDADVEDLAPHLRHAVTLARSKEIAIDWNDLLQKVRGWRDKRRWAQRAWARDFWGKPRVEPEEMTS